MTGQAGAHTNRPELVAIQGYDTKYAMHAFRLGCKGIELLTSGRITLPIPEPHRGYLRSIAVETSGWLKSSTRLATRRQGSPNCGTALPYPISPTGAGR